MLAFTIPRVPGFAFDGNSPLGNATGDWAEAVPPTFKRLPANFSFPAFADLQVDTGDNFIPLTFKNIHAKIFDLETSRQVAEGDLGHTTVPAKSFPKIQIPMNFTYVATNDTDQTCKRTLWPLLTIQILMECPGANWYNACKNKAIVQGGQRPGIIPS